MIPLNFSFVEKALQKAFSQPVKIIDKKEVHGGDINRALRLQTNVGIFFIKYNDKLQFPKMFEREATGLQLLRDSKCIRVPDVIATGHDDTYSFLILDFIERGARGENFFIDFGKSVSDLHRQSAEKFGLHEDNYIGSLPQSNKQTDSWVDFFQQERLQPLVKKAFDRKLILKSHIQHFENFYKKCDSIFPNEKPSLLHGDLWSGNFSHDIHGGAIIFDPAVYYGFREMDIAMTKLFGGFDKDFYESYDHNFPLEKKWQQRIDFCNLYPLLVHLNLFGGSYLSQIENCIRKF